MAKKKKAGKHQPNDESKSEVKEKSFQFFNDLAFKSKKTPKALIKDVHKNAKDVLKEYGLKVNVWCTFEHLEEQVTKCWNADRDFIRFWLDRLVSEFGYMIWNEVHKKYWKEDWYRDGILHNVPELPKKLRANPEAVASHFSDSAVTKYQERYK